MRTRTTRPLALFLLGVSVCLVTARCSSSKTAGRDRTCEELFELSFAEAYGLVLGRWVATGGAYFELEVEVDPNGSTDCHPPPDPCVGNTNCMGFARLPVFGRFRDAPEADWTEAQGNVSMGHPSEKVWLVLERTDGYFVSGEIEAENPSAMELYLPGPSPNEYTTYRMTRQ